MSSDEDFQSPESTVPTKKRRVQRACDMCRRKKRACDGLRMSEKKCTNCIENGLECTFAGAVAKRRSYVDVLEARLELTEQLLRKLSPKAEASASTSTGSAAGNAPSPESSSSHWSSDSPILKHRSPAPAGSPAPGPGVELAALTIRSMNTPAPAPTADDLDHIALTQDLQDLSLSQHRERFHGKSSGAMLVKAAVQMRQGYEEKEELSWSSRRMHYWTYNPSIPEAPHVGPFIFPEPDLLSDLVGLYFIHVNIYYPILHRPTLEKSIADGLHTRDESFGAVVLLVCAIATRYSDDPRVLAPGEEPLRCGWKYFDQIPNTVNHLFKRPNLYNFQYYPLAVLFVEYSQVVACWTLVGLGIRLAQDVGAHRAGEPGSRPSVESELWKRGFWVLVGLDRAISTALGRPCTTQYEDFDAELPIECDDEYWEPENPARAFQQPAGKPSKIAYFTHYVRLNNLLAYSLKMLYSLNKAKKLLAVRDEAWEEHIVAELDSALNGWVDSIPTHLRWDPNRRDDIFFDQSAMLYCVYYQVQMTIHRPFIPMIRKGAATALPSLAICTNAARSCSHVADMSKIRKNGTAVPFLLGPIFTSGLVLLLNVWSGKRTGLPPQMNSAISEVHKCMACIRVCEKRWQSAGLFWDLLYELAVIGQLPLPRPSPPAPSPESIGSSGQSNTHKRGREDDNAESQCATARVAYPPYQTQHTYSTPPNVVPNSNPPAQHTMPQFTGLPTYTMDLGRLPVYNQYNAQYAGSSSTWYPQQTSVAPLGYPDFTPGAGFGDVGLGAGLDSTGMFSPEEIGLPPAGGSGYTAGGVEFSDKVDGLSSDAMAMWANAPTGFEVDDWGTYFSVMNELNQGLATGTGGAQV
ncbi:fungal-specific transcription factor domain-containing protein [Mycena maculata]|uniref:Fungal-specific transcription factor domain-containing protein n=1 Tax=Mycena maculata TaxID=230809 RepID=A0AAD7JWR1_9AGAR|nr:fungal-specific transcription factor domain-containing protein [Mycena maculata]